LLRRIFGPKGEAVRGDWRIMHNEELHNLYFPNIIRVVKSRRMRLKVHEACVGEMANADNILVGKSKGNRPLCIDVRIRLI
jgi:hypothetical protein